jgi:hypothetical protein
MMALAVGSSPGDSGISVVFSHRHIRASSGVGKREWREQRKPIRSRENLTLGMLETG